MDLREPVATSMPRSPCDASRHSAMGVAAGAWWLLMLMLVLLAGCSRGDPETALRKAVDGLHQAVEARDPAAVQQLLAADFIGNDGLDRDGARRLMAAMLLRHRELGSTLGPLQVTMAEGHADVRFQAMLRGGSGGLLPDSAQLYDVRSSWRVEGGDWKLYHVRWTPAL